MSTPPLNGTSSSNGQARADTLWLVKPTAQRPLDTLHTGIRMLDEIMAEHGFLGRITAAGASSGGEFAAAEFQRGTRCLELQCRSSLGLVRYHLGPVSIAHDDYMWAVLGQPSKSHYPGFSNDPLDGFRHLAQDLSEYCRDFRAGSDADFLRHIPVVAELKRKRPRLP